MTRQAQIEAALRTSFIFPALGPAERERFLASAQTKSFGAGQTIFSRNDPGSSMMLIEQGEVRITYPSPDGKAVLLSELKAGTVFGEIALLDGGPRSADATAASSCKLVIFERKDFIGLLEGNWPLTEALLKLICARLRRSDERMADLAFFDLNARLAKTLLNRAKSTPGGPPRVSDTQAALANLVGGSRETVDRSLRRWEAEGLLAIAEGHITLLDTDALRRLTA